jgi:hypothetical protein
MPKPVKAARILMFIVAAITLAVAAILLMVSGVSATSLGLAMWLLLPGVASFVLALKILHGGGGVRRGIIALQLVYLLLALASLGQGDPQGLVNLGFPIAVLILLFRPEARQYFTPKFARPGRLSLKSTRTSPKT